MGCLLKHTLLLFLVFFVVIVEDVLVALNDGDGRRDELDGGDDVVVSRFVF